MEMENEQIIEIPTSFTLKQNYPNPFNPSTTIEFDLPKESHVKLDIYDLNGKLITNLFDKYINAGLHTINWKDNNQSGISIEPGIYICSVKSKQYSNNIKLVVK